MENEINNAQKLKLDRQRRRLSQWSLFLSFVLLCFKFYAYHVTQSQGIFSDALESIVNVVAGAITLAVVIIAARPADEDHPYGHGKFESIAASFEGGAIAFAGLLVVISSLQAFFHGVKLEKLDVGLWIILGTGVMNGVLGGLLWLKGKRLHSEALHSSGAHLLSDGVTSFGILCGLLLVKWTGYVWIDPVVAIIFGFILFYSGMKILIRTGNILLDGHDIETVKRIGDLFEKHYRPGVLAIHYTRVIRSGDYHHVDCHIVLPEFWSVKEAHHFSDQFEAEVSKDYPVGVALHMHLDPCRQVYCEHCELKDCGIRQKEFVKRLPLNDLEEMLSTSEKI